MQKKGGTLVDRIIIVTSQRQDRDATAHAACESKSLVGHRAPQDFAKTRERSGKSACRNLAIKNVKPRLIFGSTIH
jgi:hypothetical protein